MHGYQALRVSVCCSERIAKSSFHMARCVVEEHSSPRTRMYVLTMRTLLGIYDNHRKYQGFCRNTPYWWRRRPWWRWVVYLPKERGVEREKGIKRERAKCTLSACSCFYPSWLRSSDDVQRDLVWSATGCILAIVDKRSVKRRYLCTTIVFRLVRLCIGYVGVVLRLLYLLCCFDGGTTHFCACFRSLLFLELCR